MDALTPLLLLGAAYGLVTAIAFQALKPFPEFWLFGQSKTHPLHDPTMRLLLFAVAVVIVLLSTLAGLRAGAALDFAGGWIVLKTAAGASLIALVTYHALNGDILGSLTVGGGATVMQAPPALPAEPTAVVVPPQSKPTVVVQPPTVATSTAPTAPAGAATSSDAALIAGPVAPASPSPPPVASSS